MAVKLQGQRRRRLSMTSLIDVIFLLLLFFMLTSTFSKYGEVELMAAGQGAKTQDRQKLFVTLGAERLMLNGQQADLARIADLVRLQPQDGGGHLVLISPDDTASAQRLVDLLTALRQVEGLQTVVLG
ncbi:MULTISPECIES: ExbD/TolR family protein [Rhodobacterales]|jgi:biopolymer transport protein ExbD|uniref:Biopolymer transporter ExbD n=1 Tax=Phaeobacter gallaeciensis TaxID=60890 RepID=A0ABD4XA81_9RHOB|nr:biopolymer transporter ExbD [Phaeobacter gallaeciensis]MDF1773602.1 biopolymer transporter ExbD [Pseudophaeobacter sp. bin_em_oilr2.035]MDE4141155.1 biopolymer transporter ExbD [Phaeobacter gallaeciensis]MDE4144925.1 biopolymer transporter ExbD [Phaeobacter gallaeciensis]MDE4149600.1 biopolymer transporter ExbD [Phaeobacter gallaeciensis]MDE4153950.1 biopolymer transporter ExbD [Phaeobacter gallaeciensis]